MTGRGEDSASAAGGPAPHVPVLLEEVCSALRADAGGIFPGRHVRGRRLCARHSRRPLPKNRVIAIDRDPSAIAAGQNLVAAYGGRLRLVEGGGRFGDCAQIAADAGVAGRLDGVVLDIGVSPRCSSTSPNAASPSVSTARSTCAWRGKGESAADLVNGARRSASGRYHLSLRRGAPRPRHRPAPSSNAAAGRPSRPRAISPNSFPVWCARSRTGRTRRRERSRGCASRSMMSWTKLARALHGAEQIPRSRRPSGRRDLPFAGRPHRPSNSSPRGRDVAAAFSRMFRVTGPGPQPSFRSRDQGSRDTG